MNDGKTKTLISHILEQCEKQGLTEAEVKELPELLKLEIKNTMGKKSKITPFHYCSR